MTSLNFSGKRWHGSFAVVPMPIVTAEMELGERSIAKAPLKVSLSALKEPRPLELTLDTPLEDGSCVGWNVAYDGMSRAMLSCSSGLMPGGAGRTKKMERGRVRLGHRGEMLWL